MNSFSVGILTYNHKDFIIQLLESLKYQVLKYGKDYKIYLHIVDDKSSDETQLLIQKWLDINKSIFYEIDFIKNKINKGVVYNHNLLIGKINTDYFKIIAGDDVISSENLFNCCSKLDDCELKQCSCLVLGQDNLKILRIAIRLNLFCKKYIKSKRKLLNFLSFCSWLIMPEACFTLNLWNNSGCSSYNSECIYMEDLLAWWAMIKNNKDFCIDYSLEVPILWRQSDSSISNSQIYSNNKIQQQWQKDIYHFKKMCSKDVNLLNRFFINYEIYHYKKTGSFHDIPKIIDRARYIFKFIDFIMKMKSNKKLEDDIANKLESKIDNENKHYQMIKSNAERFISENFN